MQKFILAGSFLLGVCNADAQSVKLYRYQRDMPNSESTYAGEIIKEGKIKGSYYEVETDAENRIIRVAEMRGKQKNEEYIYTYQPGEKYYSGSKNYSNGELTGTSKLKRDASAFVTLAEYFTTAGVRTGYAERIQDGDHVQRISYTADGIAKDTVWYYYKDNVLAQRKRFSKGRYFIDKYDETTGVKTMFTLYDQSNTVQQTAKWTYDTNGDVQRQDLYDASGKWLGHSEYDDGLIVKRSHKYVNGEPHEFRVSYHENRTAMEAKVFHNDKLICIMTYDRLADGTVTRTLATSPKGELMAEYPNKLVVDVGQDGRTPDGSGTIHKTGNWW